MTIQSRGFDNNQRMPVKYTCDGENISPPLAFSDVPAETKSLALIVVDPDAPAGEFTHWTVWNIDPGTAGIPEAVIPENAETGKNSTGNSGYTGPCPPRGSVHRYYFTVYALSTVLNIGTAVSRDQLELNMSSAIVTSARIIGLYGRK